MVSRFFVESRDVAHALRWVAELRGVLDELREAVAMAPDAEMAPAYYGRLVTRRGELVEVLEEVSAIGRDGFTRRVAAEGPQAPSLREDYRFLEAVTHEISLREISDLLDSVEADRSGAYAATSALLARLALLSPLQAANKDLYTALCVFHASTVDGASPLAFLQTLKSAKAELAQAVHVRR